MVVKIMTRHVDIIYGAYMKCTGMKKIKETSSITKLACPNRHAVELPSAKYCPECGKALLSITKTSTVEKHVKFDF
jgi:predicted RNA-binding Zn-ribbon protein involved in translation (DUF1610 family)